MDNKPHEINHWSVLIASLPVNNGRKPSQCQFIRLQSETSALVKGAIMISAFTFTQLIDRVLNEVMDADETFSKSQPSV